MTNETTRKRTRYLAAGVREIARRCGYSIGHVSMARKGLRKSRPLHAKMRALGLKFKPVEG